MNGRNRLIKD